MDSGRSSNKPSLEVYHRKRARRAILKYGNACALSSGGGSAQGKTWWKPPLTRWRKCEKKLRLPFFRLKSWKGCYSQSRWTFFWRGFEWKKSLLAVTKWSFSSFSYAGNASAGMFLSFWGVTICYYTVKAFDRQPDESMASSKPTHLANGYEPNGDGFV